jgi:quercetin dioxygenase-like cupin family protein
MSVQRPFDTVMSIVLKVRAQRLDILEGRFGKTLGAAIAVILFAGSFFPLRAEDPMHFLVWKSARLDDVEKKLHLRLDEPGKGAHEDLIITRNHSAIMAYREGMPPQAEIHQKFGDFAFIRDGDVAVLVGGKLSHGETSAPDEVRGTIEGATLQRLKTGDLVYIPPRVPHQWQIQPGKKMYLELFKVQPNPSAAQRAKYLFWSAAELANLDKQLASKVDETKSAHEDLATGDFNTVLVHREGSAASEIHEHLADFDIVRSGEGIMLLGGKVTGGKSTGPGEIRGTSIEGGTKQRLASGDLLYIPANVPHQFLADPGKQFDVMVLKVWAKD